MQCLDIPSYISTLSTLIPQDTVASSRTTFIAQNEIWWIYFFYKMICIKPALSRRCFLDCSEFRINLLCQEYFSMLFEPAVYKNFFDLLLTFWRSLYIHTSCWNERPRRWQRWWWRYWPCSTPPRPHSRSRCPWSAPDMFMTRGAAGRDGIIFVLDITSWGGTPSVIVLKSTFWYDSMQGRTKNIPVT